MTVIVHDRWISEEVGGDGVQNRPLAAGLIAAPRPVALRKQAPVHLKIVGIDHPAT
jgi:hypothetical protein